MPLFLYAHGDTYVTAKTAKNTESIDFTAFYTGMKNLLKSSIELGTEISERLTPAISGLAKAVEWVLNQLPDKSTVGNVGNILKLGTFQNSGKHPFGYDHNMAWEHDYKKILPKWAEGLTHDDMRKLDIYMDQYWGGKKAGWMEKQGNADYWRDHHAFDLSLNPDYDTSKAGAVLTKAQKKKTEDLLGSMSDSIVGGGRKQITINMHAPLIGRQEFNVRSMAEALGISLDEFKRAYLQVLQGANAAL